MYNKFFKLFAVFNTNNLFCIMVIICLSPNGLMLCRFNSTVYLSKLNFPENDYKRPLVNKIKQRSPKQLVLPTKMCTEKNVCGHLCTYVCR